jgi:formylmethanofuran--tetrahydromethanopterin N-formyltransferase
MRHLTVKRLRVDDTFAEAFTMRATGVIITADSAHWARQAAVTMTGFATSVIGCGCEAGIDHELTPRETPDGRPGVRVLLFAVSKAAADQGRPVRAHEPRVCVLRRP